MFAAAALVILVSGSSFDVPKQQSFNPLTTAYPPQQWVSGPWTRSSNEIIRLRLEIEQKVKDGAERKALIAKHRELAFAANPSRDSLAVWAFAMYQGLNWHVHDRVSAKETRRALNGLKGPFAREEARIAFVLEALLYSPPGWIPVGKELVKTDAKDNVSRYWLARLITKQPTESNAEEGLKHAHILTKSSPEDPNYWHLQATCSMMLYTKTEKIQYAKDAIVGYETALKYFPEDHPDVMFCNTFIAYLKGEVKKNGGG
jgi:hypothetical protein